MSVKPISQHITLIDAPFHGAKGTLGTYLIKADKTAIIDPGSTAGIPHINNALNTLNTTHLTHIIPTHIHLDHAGGTWKLMETYPLATLIVHPRGRQHMIDPTKLEKGARALFGDHVNSYGQIKGTPPTRTNESSDNQEITLGDVTLKILWTPESLNRLIELSPETICYGHFGCSGDAVKKLIDHREQIRTWLQVIEDNWEKGRDLNMIYKAIREADARAREFNSKQGEHSLRINLQGFIKYIEWEKTRQ
jgi:glyoxylase-like metal-dependent hydrolase (beta-lactamase superfamily II)